MVSLNATTFWEVSGYGAAWADALGSFGPLPPPVPAHSSGSDSMCHPWSSGATAWLTEHALGLRPAAPGYGITVLQPTLARVSGAVPTPLGVVSAHIDAVAGVHTVTLPAGMRLHACVS